MGEGIEISGKKKEDIIKIVDLMKGGISKLSTYPQHHFQKLEKYRDAISACSFSVINMLNADIDIATEVFTRLNVGGKALTLFEIMVAKTYQVFPSSENASDSEEKIFDLSEKYELLASELKESKYDTIPSSTILQVVSILLKKDCSRKTILKLEKGEFIEIWDKAVKCIKSSIDFFKGYGIAVSRILPYNALIVPFSYFFYKHQNNPSGVIKDRLEDFFWRVALGFRYSSGTESKLAQDIQKIDKILEGHLPAYEWVVNVNEEFIETHGWFSTGKSFIKAILCLYSKQKPKAFKNGLDVILDNSNLLIASSKNYHHFFPKAWMSKNRTDIHYNMVNHIINITIVDANSNKNEIRAKSPSAYMRAYQNDNNNLEKNMKTHFIELNKDGIWEDDFEKFYKNRKKRISSALKRFLIPQEVNIESLEVYEDIEENEDP